jgi:hypothetical protein
MRRSIALVFVMLAALAKPVLGEERPMVVVELFTSQGCSSCPPADAFLHELAAREDVLALGLHVDYWDYIGWKDVFGHAAFSERQRAYAKAGGRRSVYTPQMIINGQQHVVGNHPQEVAALIRRHQAQPPEARLRLTREGAQLHVAAEADSRAPARAVTVLLIRFLPEAVTDIKRGENAGKQISYANIVTEIVRLQTWDMRAPLRLTAQLGGTARAAVVLQGQNAGPILAAALAD